MDETIVEEVVQLMPMYQCCKVDYRHSQGKARLKNNIMWQVDVYEDLKQISMYSDRTVFIDGSQDISYTWLLSVIFTWSTYYVPPIRSGMSLMYNRYYFVAKPCTHVLRLSERFAEQISWKLL